MLVNQINHSNYKNLKENLKSIKISTLENYYSKTNHEVVELNTNKIRYFNTLITLRIAILLDYKLNLSIANTTM